MAQEFIPTESVDVALLSGWNGKLIASELLLPSGAKIPVPPIGCIWRVQNGKCVSQKGAIRGMMK